MLTVLLNLFIGPFSYFVLSIYEYGLGVTILKVLLKQVTEFSV